MMGGLVSGSTAGSCAVPDAVPEAVPDAGNHYAYLLIQTESGRVGAAVNKLSDLPDVGAVDPVTGPYDVIARITGQPVPDAVDRVRAELADVEGIGRTLTLNGSGSGKQPPKPE